MIDPTDLATAAKASPHMDVIQAVAQGKLSTRHAEQIIRRRDRDAKRPQTTRVFHSLPEGSANRAERRKNASINRANHRANMSMLKIVLAHGGPKDLEQLAKESPRPLEVKAPGKICRT